MKQILFLFLFLISCESQEIVQFSNVVFKPYDLRSIEIEEWLTSEEIVEQTKYVQVNDTLINVLSKTENTLTVSYKFVFDVENIYSIKLLNKENKVVGHLHESKIKYAVPEIHKAYSNQNISEMNRLLENSFRFYPVEITELPPIEI